MSNHYRDKELKRIDDALHRLVSIDEKTLEAVEANNKMITIHSVSLMVLAILVISGLVLLTTWYTNLKTDAELAAEGVEKVTLELQKFKEEMEVTGIGILK
jgi:flagellar basal body-associated protein FliL